MQRVAEPRAVEEVLDRPDRPEQGAHPAVVELAERFRPAVVECDEPGQQVRHVLLRPCPTDRTPREAGPDAARGRRRGRARGPPFPLRWRPRCTTARPAAADAGRSDWRRILSSSGSPRSSRASASARSSRSCPSTSRRWACPDADRLRSSASSAALIFVVGMPLVPLWGVWADKYSRKAVVVRSALVEAVVFAASPSPASRGSSR